ncbi:hypothetical protein BUALT_Bualt06G0020400 [Buddleja alternifolia]|uniref:Uncharacterized protein n=1 Tax=Buddleja alternifolia TaxID=168488 RepID=A0AAV6XBM1_9LAMI|nr:hypothetical protein BUALT_Bualt06G0020400 [Buddleja alternifolia]
MYDTIDESEETLSFCDLPLYSDNSERGEDLSIESQGSSSISSSEQDYFEFSQELNPTSQPENIIFCGKLIPYKQLHPSEKDSSEIVERNTQINIKKKSRWELFKWKFNATKQVHPKNGKTLTTLVQKSDQSQSKMHNKKHEKGYNFPVHKTSIVTSTSSGKARWSLFMFGSSSFSTQMELKDIKRRRSLRQCPPPALRFPNQDDKVSGGENGDSGLSGLIRVLSCGGSHHPNTMAVASIR